MITISNLREALACMGFCERERESNKSEIWEKKFPKHSCKIEVDFTNKKIIYPNDLKYGDTTTQNFNKPENFVVLECVDRLLSIGYKSKNIELEPKWKLGHESKTSGKADIIVKDENEKIYPIIECKTYGNEFDKEKANMLRDGGQLFSYFTQDTNAKFVCLYTCDFINESVKREYFAVDMQDSDKFKTNLLYKNANSTSEIYEVWKKTYEFDSFSTGIFEDNLTPYKIQEISPNIENLQELSHDDIQKKYHEFATILRQHNISGRENAFDKLLNLFLCKVIDEKINSDKLEFNYQGKRYDDIYDFCDRLQKLYQKGMKDFLNTEITYVSNDQINKAFRFVKKDPDATKDKINNLFTQLKYYTNNDFAFIEVYNKELFEQNTQILIKMVKMLENIRLTGSSHNQFLGDLFEGFLDSGVKQSEGQFFTPLPIVKFIISSLPIKEILSQNDEVLAIDYACGAGHFLNEYANYIRNFTNGDETKQKALEKGIYGIEKETRLAKVSKVASFMYNQNINILGKDALSDIKEIKNNKFQILIANPPYSVKGFLSTLTQTEREAYELSNIVGENLETNNAIECFFIERASQILSQNAVAGIIVPSSLINKNGEIYKKTREILLRNFKIIAVSEFGNKTFGQTGTNTVVLFLRKFSQNPSLFENLKARSEHIFKGDLNDAYDDTNDLEKYCEFMDYDFNQFLNFIRTGEFLQNEIFDEYRVKIQKSGAYKTLAKKKTITQDELDKFIKDEIIEIERAKFIYFMLICDQKTLISKSPSDNKEQSKFLGYEWSNRKGSEGIKYLNQTISDDEDELTESSKALQSINTALYDPSENPNDENSLNSDKLNFWIRENFAAANEHCHSERSEESHNTKQSFSNLQNSQISKFTRFVNLRDCIDFKKAEFDLAINLSAQSKIEIVSKYPLERFETLVFSNGKGKRPVSFENPNGTITFYKSSQEVYKCDTADFNGEALIIGDGGSANIHYHKGEFSSSDHTYIFTKKDNANLKFIYYFLNSNLQILESKFTGIAIKNISKTSINNIKIPLPPIDIQQQIVDECQSVDNEIANLNSEISEFKKQSSEIFDKFNIKFDENLSSQGETKAIYKFVKISEIVNLIRGVTYDKNNVSLSATRNAVLTADNIDLDGNFVLNKKIYIDESVNFDITKRLSHNDIFICLSSGSKTHIGKVAFINKNTDYFIGGFMGILRTKENAISKYVYMILNNEKIREIVRNLSTGSNINNLNSKILDLKIPLPPIEAQEQIVAEFESLEKQIAVRKERLETLKNAYNEILDKYLK